MTLMNTMNAPGTTTTVEPDERVVEEVHCIECGVPISAIPNWYATVNVKFTCDNCRQKSPKLAALAPVDLEAPRSSVDPDAEVEPALDDIDVDDIEIDEADIDPVEE